MPWRIWFLVFLGGKGISSGLQVQSGSKMAFSADTFSVEEGVFEYWTREHAPSVDPWSPPAPVSPAREPTLEPSQPLDSTCPSQASIEFLIKKLCAHWNVDPDDVRDAPDVFPKPSHSPLLLHRSRSPFWKAFLRVPSLLSSTLASWGIFPIEQDGPLVFELLSDDVTFTALIKDIVSLHGSKLDSQECCSLTQHWFSLLQSILATLGISSQDGYPSSVLRVSSSPSMDASGSIPSDSSEPLIFDLGLWAHDALSLKQFFKANFQKSVSISEIPLKKWKHYRSRDVKALPPQSQMEIERALKFRWLDRLLGHLIPFAATIPNMAKVMSSEDPVQEYKDLFGKLRWRTIRIYTVNLETMLRLPKFKVPWLESTVRALLQQCRHEEVRPSKISSYWSTLKALGSRLGILSPESVDTLKQKKEAVTDVLVDKVVKPSKKAVVPPVEILNKLEMACKTRRDAKGHLLPAGLHFYASMGRFACGSSPRFGDMQHTALSSFSFTSSSVEAFPWQTKTVSKGAQTKPTVLIAPKHCFEAGSAWWESLQAWISVFLAEGDPSKLDFCFPELTQDFQGFIFRPVDHYRGLRIFKELLFRLEISPHFLEEGTWHSLRVLMSELAFLALVPGSLRKYLGNWAKDTTADIYTREKRAVVSKIYDKIIPFVQHLNPSSTGRQVRVDLDHEEWDDEHMHASHLESQCITLASAKRKLEMESPSAKRGVLSPSYSDRSQPVDASGSTPRGPSSEVGTAEAPPGAQELDDDFLMVSSLYEESSRAAPEGTPGNLVPPPVGPLQVYYRTTRSSVIMDDGFRRSLFVLHLVSLKDGIITEVGKGWQPPKGAVQPITFEDYLQEPSEYHMCRKCFQKYSLPQDWSSGFQEHAVSDASSDSDSLSSISADLSADSESEAEAFKPTQIPDSVG